jgi:LacI family transcriptional regulator, gluconate utilization system Gnt-I transcriptional repressor
MKRKPGINDIAKLARVSRMTVSRALSKPELVSGETLRRIHNSAAHLGYTPARPPAHLTGAPNGLIGVVLPSIDSSLFVDLVRGVQQIAEQASLDVLIGVTDWQESKERQILHSFLSRRPDGLVFVGSPSAEHSKLLRQQLQWLGVVQVWEKLVNPIDMQVGFDNEAAGILAAEHLCVIGRKRLAYIGETAGRDGQRWQGFRATAKKILRAEPLLVDLSIQAELLNPFIDDSKILSDIVDKKIDAVFCGTDELALSLLFNSIRAGVIVPDRLAICGCGDRPLAEVVEPRLTSIQIPGLEIGRKAVSQLLTRLERGQSPPSEIMHPQLHIRHSTVATAPD